jgi:Holliday junction resolvase RusA-like endonuclease
MRFDLSRNSGARVVALQLGVRPDRLYVGIPGRFVQKNRGNAAAVFEAVAQEARRSAASLGWKMVPRARVAVEIRFHSRHDGIPDLHHLVKAYLDPLRGIAFTDDRQVAYLVATSWKPPRQFSERNREDDNHLMITVERFADYMRCFDPYHTLKKDFDFCHASRSSQELEDEEDRISPLEFGRRFEAVRDDSWLDAFGLTAEQRADWRWMQMRHFQEALLTPNRIDEADRPNGTSSPFVGMREVWKFTGHAQPFVAELDGFPGPGESKAYKAQVRERFRALTGLWKRFARFVLPIELDVQVPEEQGRPDLDNIMRRYIVPAVSEELVQAPQGYVHGYRVYTVKPERPGERGISVKVMPEGAIQKFADAMNKALDAGREW